MVDKNGKITLSTSSQHQFQAKDGRDCFGDLLERCLWHQCGLCPMDYLAHRCGYKKWRFCCSFLGIVSYFHFNELIDVKTTDILLPFPLDQFLDLPISGQSTPPKTWLLQLLVEIRQDCLCFHWGRVVHLPSHLDGDTGRA